MRKKLNRLQQIYQAFDTETGPVTSQKACTPGCSFCCEAAGSIDMTTLEGIAIRRAMAAMPRNRQTALTKAFRKEIKQREAGTPVPCPFLMKNKNCMVYESRPFACRRIYSAHICTADHPPAVHRQIMAAADQTIRELQKLDDTGYSGHLSYILYMLSVPAFLTTYEAGEFKPEEVMEFGRAHKIAINRMML